MKSMPVSILAAIAPVLSERVEPCPWNPFPPDSHWGREIENRYQEDRRRQRREVKHDR